MIFERTAGRPWPLIHLPRPYTTADLARMCGVSHSAAAAWRQGTRRPSQAHLARVAAFLMEHLSDDARAVLPVLYGYLPVSLEALATVDPTAAGSLIVESWHRLLSCPRLDAALPAPPAGLLMTYRGPR